jgi:hypothetical protein
VSATLRGHSPSCREPCPHEGPPCAAWWSLKPSSSTWFADRRGASLAGHSSPCEALRSLVTPLLRSTELRASPRGEWRGGAGALGECPCPRSPERLLSKKADNRRRDEHPMHEHRRGALIAGCDRARHGRREDLGEASRGVARERPDVQGVRGARGPGGLADAAVLGVAARSGAPQGQAQARARRA